MTDEGELSHGRLDTKVEKLNLLRALRFNLRPGGKITKVEHQSRNEGDVNARVTGKSNGCGVTQRIALTRC